MRFRFSGLYRSIGEFELDNFVYYKVEEATLRCYGTLLPWWFLQSKLDRVPVYLEIYSIHSLLIILHISGVYLVLIDKGKNQKKGAL